MGMNANTKQGEIKMTEIERIKKENMSFIASDDDLNDVVRENRFQKILIRCGNGRLVCSAQDAEHFVRIIQNSNEDHVRDLSLV
jgi:hypothetical protein